MPTGGFTQNLIKTIFLASLSFSLFALSFSLASAQDAIQCTPADVSLNRNLKFVNPASNNIYLGTGKLNFSSGNSDIYATQDASHNLLFRNLGAQILTQSNTILFENPNTPGDRIAGIYNTNPFTPAVSDTHYLIVDGKIEGWTINALGNAADTGLCIRGRCVQSWEAVNTTAYGEDDTDNQALTYDSVTGVLKISKSNSEVTITSGGGVTQIVDGDGAGGISVSPASGDGIVTLTAIGGSTGVSKINVGTGLSIISAPDTTGNPTSGTGEVTINMSGSSPCVAGFTRIGSLCLDTDGDLIMARGPVWSNDAAYVPISPIPAAKAVILKVVAYANWRVSKVWACVIPGDQPTTSGCSELGTLGAWAQDDDSKGGAASEVTVRTGAGGSILTKCTTTGDGGGCWWYISGYID